MDFMKIADVFADVMAFLADFFAKITEFAGGFEKRYAFEDTTAA